jgi:hypothetical protein
MSSTPRKSSTSKKPVAARAKRGNGSGKESRDAETGRLVEKANDHMERAWGKIYGRSGKAGSRK